MTRREQIGLAMMTVGATCCITATATAWGVLAGVAIAGLIAFVLGVLLASS